MTGTYLNIPHCREAVFAGCAARNEERGVVVPLKRRATLQRARKGASRLGFDALARITLLRALQMRYGHSTRRASRLRTNASETRLMGNVEIGSIISESADVALRRLPWLSCNFQASAARKAELVHG